MVERRSPKPSMRVRYLSPLPDKEPEAVKLQALVVILSAAKNLITFFLHIHFVNILL